MIKLRRQEGIRPVYTAFEYIRRSGGGLPGRAHVEEVDEEVRRQCLATCGEDACRGSADICARNAQAAEEDGHLWCYQRHELRAFDEQLLRRSLVGEIVAEAICGGLEHRERRGVPRVFTAPPRTEAAVE
jgi:hypothetical protein